MDQVKTGELIRHMRVQLGLTQKQLADRMGISQSYISRLEKRILLKIKSEMLKHMA